MTWATSLHQLQRGRPWPSCCSSRSTALATAQYVANLRPFVVSIEYQGRVTVLALSQIMIEERALEPKAGRRAAFLEALLSALQRHCMRR